MEKNTVPFFAFEAAIARIERINKRLWIALVISILANAVAFVMWFVK